MQGARELFTIGDLTRATPLARSRRRRRRTLGYVDIGAAADSSAIDYSAPQYDAAVTFLNYLDSAGTPNEHVFNQETATFQAAVGVKVDGSYGPDTKAELDHWTGGLAHEVDSSTPPGPGPSPSPGPSPLVLPAKPGEGHMGTILLFGGLAVGAWFLFFRKKKRSSGHTVEVRSNPRRRRAARRR